MGDNFTPRAAACFGFRIGADDFWAHQASHSWSAIKSYLRGMPGSGLSYHASSIAPYAWQQRNTLTIARHLFAEARNSAIDVAMPVGAPGPSDSRIPESEERVSDSQASRLDRIPPRRQVSLPTKFPRECHRSRFIDARHSQPFYYIVLRHQRDYSGPRLHNRDCFGLISLLASHFNTECKELKYAFNNTDSDIY